MTVRIGRIHETMLYRRIIVEWWSGLDDVEWSSGCGRSGVKQEVDNKFRTNESGLKVEEVMD